MNNKVISTAPMISAALLLAFGKSLFYLWESQNYLLLLLY